MICQCNGSHEMQPILIISVLSHTNKSTATYKIRDRKCHHSDFTRRLISETLKDQSLFAAFLPFHS